MIMIAKAWNGLPSTVWTVDAVQFRPRAGMADVALVGFADQAALNDGNQPLGSWNKTYPLTDELPMYATEAQVQAFLLTQPEWAA